VRLWIVGLPALCETAMAAFRAACIRPHPSWQAATHQPHRQRPMSRDRTFSERKSNPVPDLAAICPRQPVAVSQLCRSAAPAHATSVVDTPWTPHGHHNEHLSMEASWKRRDGTGARAPWELASMRRACWERKYSTYIHSE
jgi:hypothetical protein